jgi:Family of unknown function (DUF5309)
MAPIESENKMNFSLLVAGFVLALVIGPSLILLHHAMAYLRFSKLWKRCLREADERFARVRAESEALFPGCWGHALNAVTTEPGLRVARSKDITHEDFVDAIDRINPAATPLMSLATNEVKLKAVDRTWNVDSYPGVKGALGRADNEAAPASGSANSRDWAGNIRKVGNIAQAFSETWRAGWIAERVPQVAGVSDLVSYAKAGAYEMLKQHEEAAMCSFDQVAVYDQGSGLGAVMAGYRKLTDDANKYAAASAYAIGKASDIHFAPTGACLTGVLTAVHSRAMWKNVSLALRVAAKQSGDWMLIAGLSLRQAVTDLTIPSQVNGTGTSGITSDQVRVLLRNESDSVLGATVDTIQTDFGRIMVTESDYIGTTTTDVTGGALSAVNTLTAHRSQASYVASLKSGIIVKKGNVFKTWGVVPFTEQLGVDGGGDAFDAKCLMTFGLNNPIKAGWLLLT